MSHQKNLPDAFAWLRRFNGPLKNRPDWNALPFSLKGKLLLAAVEGYCAKFDRPAFGLHNWDWARIAELMEKSSMKNQDQFFTFPPDPDTELRKPCLKTGCSGMMSWNKKFRSFGKDEGPPYRPAWVCDECGAHDYVKGLGVAHKEQV